MLKMIVACGINGEVGKDNNLLWDIPEDRLFFKQQTIGHVVVMGRKTFESLPQPLKNRVNIVLSNNYSNGDYHFEMTTDGTHIYHMNLTKFLEFKGNYPSDIYVIGGAEIYRLLEPQCEELIVTRVGGIFEKADTYFEPKLHDYLKPQMLESGISSGKKSFPYYIVRYVKKEVEIHAYI